MPSAAMPSATRRQRIQFLRWCRFGLTLLFVASAAGAFCGDRATDPDRPRVGLALSGGGARGVAHLGVLHGLEKLGIPIDCVAGTSMGAVVGGLYAAGLPLSRIETLLIERDWGALFADRTSFRQLAFRRKQVERRYRFGVRLGMGKGGIRLPTGLSPGQQFGAILQSHLIDADADFDQLPVPFRAVATDIVTGERVVLGGGSLAHAIQASATLPGVLAPLEIDGRLLVDGGLVDNLPVDVVRGMGADVVIAVDISEPLYRRDQIDSLVAITWQVVGIQTRGNMVSQLAAADLVLVPELEGFTSGSFDQVAVMVGRGEEAVTAAAARLHPWVADRADVSAMPAAAAKPAPIIRSVRFEGLVQVDERRLTRRLSCLPGDTLDVSVLQEDAASLFASDRFERVGVRSEPESDGVAVIYNVLEREDATLLRGDVRLSADSEGETDFRAMVSAARVDLNARGGSWRTDMWVGEPRGVMTTLHQPIDFAGRYFVAPSLRVSQERQDVYSGDDKQAEYEVSHRRFTLDVGRQWGPFGELRLGWVRGHTDAEDIVGVSGLASRDDAVGRAHASVRLDTTDDRSFPRRGLSLDASLFWSHRDLGADQAYRRAHVDALFFVPVGQANALFGGVSGGRRLGDDRLPADTQFQLGGLFSLGGYPVGRFRGDAVATARLGGLRQIAQLPPGLGGRIVGGAVAEWGMAWRQPEDARLDDLRLGLTAFVGADTLLGPLLIGYGWAEDGNSRFYVALGQGIR